MLEECCVDTNHAVIPPFLYFWTCICPSENFWNGLELPPYDVQHNLLVPSPVFLETIITHGDHDVVALINASVALECYVRIAVHPEYLRRILVRQ